MFKNYNFLVILALCLCLVFLQSIDVAAQARYSTEKSTNYQIQFSALECRLNSSIMAVGQITQAVAYAYDSNGTAISLEGFTVIFSTGNAEIASVNNSGIVTALAEGTAIINLTVIKDGNSQMASAVLQVGVLAISDDLSDISKRLSLSNNSYFTKFLGVETYPYIWYVYANNESLIYKSNDDITNVKIKALRNGEPPQTGTYDLRFYVSKDNVKYIDVSSRFTRVRTRPTGFLGGTDKYAEDTFTSISLPSDMKYIKIVNTDYQKVYMQCIEAIFFKPIRILGNISKSIADNKLNVTLSVKNNNIFKNDVKAMLVIYKNGILKSMTESSLIIEANDKSSITITASVPQEIANCSSKIMIWDDTKKLKPLLNTYSLSLN